MARIVPEWVEETASEGFLVICLYANKELMRDKSTNYEGKLAEEARDQIKEAIREERKKPQLVLHVEVDPSHYNKEEPGGLDDDDFFQVLALGNGETQWPSWLGRVVSVKREDQ